MSTRPKPSLGTRAWVCLPRRHSITISPSTHCTCKKHVSPSSNQMHRCCARCCTPRGAPVSDGSQLLQRGRKAAGATTHRPFWSMSRRVSNAPIMRSPHWRWRRGRGHQAPSNDDFSAIVNVETPGICARPLTRCKNVHCSTTSVQLNIANPCAGGVKINTKTFNQGLVVEYMGRAQGPTVDFFSQNLRGTHTRPTKSHCGVRAPMATAARLGHRGAP